MSQTGTKCILLTTLPTMMVCTVPIQSTDSIMDIYTTIGLASLQIGIREGSDSSISLKSSAPINI